MTLFTFQLGLSFLIGGVWIALTSMAAERLGPRLGGLIGGLPSLLAVAMLFIGWTQGLQQVYDATTAVPLTMAVNAFYLIAYALLLRRGVAVAIGGAMTLWAVLQTAIVLLDPRRYDWALVGWALALLAAYLIIRPITRGAASGPQHLAYTPAQLLGRGAFGGAVIVAAVALSKIGGPIFGSVFSVFPAVFTSTLVITARSVGPAFTLSLVTPLMVSAVVNVVVYAIALRLAVLPLGLIGGSAAAYAVSLVSAALTHCFLKSRAP
jgi:hypothetical protein